MNPTKQKCLHCGTPYEAQRSHSKYCGVNCRNAAHAARRIQPDAVWAVLDAKARKAETRARHFRAIADQAQPEGTP